LKAIVSTHQAVLPSKPSDRSPPVSPRPATAAPAQPPTVRLDPCTLTNNQLLRWMFGFMSPVKPLIFLACLYLTLACTLEILLNNQSGLTVDHIQNVHGDAKIHGLSQWLHDPDPAASAVRHSLIILSLLLAGFLVMRYVREVTQTKLSMRMVFYIREAVYDKLQRVGFSFHDALSSGALINRALSDLQNVRQFIQTAVLTTLEIVLIVIGNIILVWTKNPWLALLSLVPLPIWTWYIVRFGRKVQPAAKAVMEADDRNVALITEAIAGVHVIKAFATEQEEISKYESNCDNFFQRVTTRIRLFADFTPIIRMIGHGSFMLLFLAAGVLIIRGRLMAGDLLILGSAMGAVLGRLQQVSAINEQYQNAMVSGRRLYEVLAAKPTVVESPTAHALPRGPGAVRFENVTFGYAPDKPVLKNVSFDIPGGSVVALVGPTGAGKSTLVNLIARFYDPQQGRILIDGVDAREVTVGSIRTQVSFVFQETYLFSDTVEANIAYGRPSITGGEIEAAARLAQAHDFVEVLPMGYQTILAERGSSLSGGQRQRLAIARAILSDPRILVLDDATASVDPETEDLIRRGMNVVMSDRTTFLIAHRISTVKRADVVMVIEEGRVTQMGTHDELVAQDGHYRHIAAVQLYGDEAEARDGEPSHMKRMRQERRMAVAAAEDRSADAPAA
jgi:ABC-type multidrug transport system fused ATPase/permease subunit